MPLQHAYRPKTMESVIGNESTIAALKSVLARKEGLPHVYLFTGPSGTGKTTLARIVARTVGCARPDYSEMDSADFRGIDTIREVRSRMAYKPQAGPVRVWLLDECHQLTKDAQEALLKALEDTPSHVFFILCTTEPDKLKETLKRRCSHFQLSAVREADMKKHLENICSTEDKQIPEEVIAQIIGDSQGSPGIAMSILDKIIDMPPKQMMEAAKEQASLQNEAIDLCRALMGKKPWKQVREIVRNLKGEPESVRRAVLGYANSCFLRGDETAYLVLDAFRDNFFNTGAAGLSLACYEAGK